MNRTRKALVYAALAWAIIAPCLVFLRNNGDDNISRRLRALAGARLGATQADMTNATIVIPTASVDMLAELSSAEESKSDFFMMVVLASSAIVVVFCLVSMTRMYRENLSPDQSQQRIRPSRQATGDGLGR